MGAMTTWYLVRSLVGIHVAGRLLDYEEEFRVIATDDALRAQREARQIAKQEHQPYNNPFGETVHWKLDQVTEVSPLDVPEPTDGTWLYSRSYPRVSRIDQRDADRVEITRGSARAPRGEAYWYGAMLLFRLREPHPHEQERLLLFRAGSYFQAKRRALAMGVRHAAKSDGAFVGLFDVVDLFDAEIQSGTEVYWRFYRPGLIKDKSRPPRQLRWITVPELV